MTSKIKRRKNTKGKSVVLRVPVKFANNIRRKARKKRVSVAKLLRGKSNVK